MMREDNLVKSFLLGLLVGIGVCLFVYFGDVQNRWQAKLLENGYARWETTPSGRATFTINEASQAKEAE